MKIINFSILKLFILSCICFNFIFRLAAQNDTYTFSDSWGKEGCEIINSDSNSLVINYSIHNLYIKDTLIDGYKMQLINLGGVFYQNDEGSPNLPLVSKFIAIPQHSKPLVNIISYKTEIFHNIDVAPAPKITVETNNSPLKYIKNKEIFNSNKNFPSQLITISEPMQFRNIDCFALGICPFQFNPITQELTVYKDIKIEITIEGGNGHIGDDAYRNPWFDNILEDAIFNYHELPKINYIERENSKLKATGYEYIIISPTNTEFLQWADSLKKFRTEQGIKTTVIPLSDIPNGNTAIGIKTWITNAYNTWDTKPVAVLLLGDYGTDITNSINSATYNYDEYFCFTDNPYADINNDQLPDIVISRIPAKNEQQLKVMVSKCLNYERMPPSDPYFYDQPITTMGWQTERWYQICTETVGGFWKYKLNKNPNRINSLITGKPGTDPWSTYSNTEMLIKYFGKSNLNYIPDTPQELGGFEGGNASGIINAVNSGAFMILHRDHGGIDCWSNPYFSNNSISQFTNTDLCFVLSIDCSTGKFDDYNMCLAEKFLTYSDNGNNMGAVGVIAASNLSYPFLNDVFLWGIIDNFWPDFMPEYGSNSLNRTILPSFGNVAGKYFLKQTNWFSKSNGIDATCNLFHMFGDCFQLIYSEAPRNLSISHNPFLVAGVDHFNVTADSGSLIVITANGEIIARSIGTGLTNTIPIPPQSIQTKIAITATKKDYIRYSKEIETMNIQGPYFILTSNSISDPIPYGNGNGLIEYGETNFLNFNIKNIGKDSAENFTVSLTSSDEYITIEKGNKTIENLAIDSTIQFKNYFRYSVASNTPDNHKITFKITITNENEVWDFEIEKIIYAPILNIGNINFTDKLPFGNDNGKIEIGETIEFTISSANIGHSIINNVNGTLSSSDPSITVENSCKIDKLNIDETNNIKFYVKFNEEVSDAPIIFNFKLYSDNYFAQKEFTKIANIYYEDWETKTLNKMPWKLSGNNNWYIISGNEKYEGYFSAKSGKIGDNEESNLDITYTSAENDTLFFNKKVSSETCDYLKFYIDDLKHPVTYWSGTYSNWTLEKFPIKAGTHLFRWQYMKNWHTSEGDDCAWIDCIVFPKSSESTRFKKSFNNNLDCFPNPFTNFTTISYSLETESVVSIDIINMLGKKVITITDQMTESKGFHQKQFNKGNLPSGIYYLVLKLESVILTRKIIITDTF